MADDASINTRAVIGGNNPPPDPFDAIKLHMDDLYVETANWADGTEIENEAQAAEVERLLNDWKDAIKAAENVREKEIEPFTEKVTAIRERFYPLIGETKKVTGIAIRAKTALLAVKTKWANKLDAERKAEAERLRQEALAKAAEAQAALREAPDNIATVESAEDLIRDAQSMLRSAKQAEKPATKGMRTVWHTVMADKVLAVRTMWKRYPQEFLDLAQTLAEREVREGKRTIEGFVITEGKEAF